MLHIYTFSFSNVDLRTLPPQLGNLRDCWQLRLTNLNLTGLPKHVRPGKSLSSEIRNLIEGSQKQGFQNIIGEGAHKSEVAGFDEIIFGTKRKSSWQLILKQLSEL